MSIRAKYLLYRTKQLQSAMSSRTTIPSRCRCVVDEDNFDDDYDDDDSQSGIAK